VVQHRSCAVAVEAVEGRGQYTVGSEDIIRIINGAVDRFRCPDGRVGAKGAMACTGGINVLFGVYHN
jgi:hypothetical protein